MAVIVKPSVVQSQAKLRQLHNLLDQVLTGVSTWAVVQESADGSMEAGPLTLDDPLLGLLDANALDVTPANMVF
jgi:hypothetical protein